MPKKTNSQTRFKTARKNLKFWVQVLLTTDLLNDTEDRVELLNSLEVIKQEFNAKSGL
jgi:hypothetical protein